MLEGVLEWYRQAGRAASRELLPYVREKPRVGFFQPAPKRPPGTPPQCPEWRRVEPLERHAVRTIPIETQFPAITDHLAHELGEFGDRTVGASADVERLASVVCLHHENTGVREVV